MMEDIDQYKSLLTEVIAKQVIILGPDIAVLKARSVPGLEVSDNGAVVNITGDPAKVVQQLVDTYVELSGQIVKSALASIFTKYPALKKEEVD